MADYKEREIFRPGYLNIRFGLSLTQDELLEWAEFYETLALSGRLANPNTALEYRDDILNKAAAMMPSATAPQTTG